MISDFDDHLIHQTSNPINETSQSDRNFYDRFWFNGFDREAAFLFEIGFGLYPNRFVMDAHFSVSIDGEQHSFHGSRRAPRERSETQVGPLRIEHIQPLRTIRVVLDPNDTGIECDLVFRARTFPSQEPKNVMYEDGRLMMDTSRFTQFGCWEGHFTVNGSRTEVSPAQTLGTRDRSWGVRPVGEPAGGATGVHMKEPGVYWVWSPIHFDDVCTQCGTFQDHDGKPTQVSAAIVPTYSRPEDIPRHEEPGHREMATFTHRIDWEKGTRRSLGAEFEFLEHTGEKHVISLEPMIHLQLLGIGYQHPEWGHGVWHDELVTAGEHWELHELDPLDFKHIHVHQICRARMGDRVGIGTLETICFGRHDPSGFKSLLDGAP
ncbi:MAG: hypothetical protein GY725_08240 [bacterium]|nr:hypothetical protein [bacterium]